MEHNVACCCHGDSGDEDRSVSFSTPWGGFGRQLPRNGKASADQEPHVGVRERTHREPDVRQPDEGDVDVAGEQVRLETDSVGGLLEEA